MRNSVAKLCCALLLCSCLLLPACGSSIPAGTYSLTGVLVGSSPLTGTITLSASGLATSASLTYGNAAYGSPTFSTILSEGGTGNGSTAADFAYIFGANGQVALYYLATLNSSGGITICEAGTGCNTASSLQMYSPGYAAGLTGGSLASNAAVSVSASTTAAVAATPEPPTWVLALTGLLIIVAAMVARRRAGQAAPAGTAEGVVTS